MNTDDEGTRQVDAFLRALDQTQHLPAGAMRRYQERLLAKLVEHARRETDFYADRLAPLFRADGSVDFDRWHEVPVLTRRDVQENYAGLLARTLPKLAGGTDEDVSSGSTGTPIHHVTTGIQDVATAAASERFFRWHALRPEDSTVRIVATRTADAVPPHGHTRLRWRLGHPESSAIDLNVKTPVEDQVAFIRDKRPAHLMTYPTNFRELIRVAEAEGEPLAAKAILTVGEMLSDDVGQTIRAHFGREPLDRYGASEVGHIAATCPAGRLHIASELILVEIVDADGNPVAPGTPGRVVATPFYSLGMPFIRYDVGDHAVLLPEPCACGRTLPVIARVLGRTRNVFRFVDGTSLWPVLYSRDLKALVPLRQYQVVQHSLTDIEFRYVPADGPPPDLPGLTAYMQARIHPSITVRATAVDAIPRSPGGKYEDYLSLVGRAGA